MAQLFNRRMQFKVLSIKENSPIQAIITWEKQKIEANFQKGSRNTTPNTGRITVTNPNRREISLLVDAVNPLFLKFALLAGYGEDLHLVSEGHINEVNFRHSGGDINIDFTVSEANPVLKDPWASISKMNFPEGTSLIQIISNMEELGVPVEIVDPDGTNLKELQTLKIEDDIQIHEDPVQNLTDLIKQYGYSITILNEKMLIHKNIEINPRQINYKEDSLAVLNFQTGLLSASLENTYNYEDDIKTPWLSFECLWIPSVHPIAVIALNEDRYDFLNGVYFVESTQISLSNFEGDFKITGRAINASYRHTSLDPNDSGFNLDQIVPFVPQLRSLGIRLPEALQRSAITATFNPFTDA